MGVDMDFKVESYLSSHDEGRSTLLPYSPIPQITMKKLGKYKKSNRVQSHAQTQAQAHAHLTMTVAVTATMAPTTHHADSHEVTQETKKTYLP